MENLIDLHVHTNKSDGQYAPAEVIRLAKQCGIGLIAITDHDTMDGVDEALQGSQQYGVQVIPGIEISARDQCEMHILGYYVDQEDKRLQEEMILFKQYRDERKQKIIAYLQRYGINLDLREVERVAGGKLIGRPHFAQVMLEKGYVQTVREAFDKYLGTEAFAQVERPKPTPQVCIEMITEARGTAILAHPVTLKQSIEQLDATIGELKSYGLGGVECYYSEHGQTFTQECLYLARKHQLLVTGGTDFHGEKVKPEIKLGTGINGSVQFDGQWMREQVAQMR